MTRTQFAFIETFGCQMNERDSEIMAQLLSESYQQTNAMNEADVVVVNTCSIREKAEQKAFSLLGRLRSLKREKPSVIIAVTGCVAQQQGEQILRRMPHVDIVIGPRHIYHLPELIANVKKEGRQQVAITIAKDFVIPSMLPSIPSDHDTIKRFVTIMQGCDNFCSYCVVPHTRGREVSRAMDGILAEIKHLGNHGVREVTLLGQNVNSYGGDSRENGISRGFPHLLRAVDEIDAIKRIRFTTSHPKDLSVELMRCFQELDKLCPHIHLPVQSGSDRILKKMNRHYTIATYLEKVGQLQMHRPDIAITTDIIVGFPGETEEDFSATMALLDKVRFHGAFSFKYSDRPQARSSQFSEKIDEATKTSRLAILQKRQDEITLERNYEYIGNTIEVMHEGRGKASPLQATGRTATHHIVNYTGAPPKHAAGEFIRVKIEEACLHSLRGAALPES